MEQPTPVPKRDPYVVGFLVLLTVTLVTGIALAIQAYVSHQPSTAAGATMDGGLARLGTALKQLARGVHEKTREIAGGRLADSRQQAPQPGPAAAATSPERTYPGVAVAPPSPHVRPVPAGAGWTYTVHFGSGWQPAGQLHYETRRAASGNAPQATMSWQPSGGQRTTWDFGTVAANHPSHANTRFPGFFMHAAYLPHELKQGAQMQWDFPWQGGAAGSERVRRFELQFAGWEKVTVPAGEFDAARLDGTLRYIEQGGVRAQVRYTLWYAPAARQTVRLRWLGRAPDESSGEMIAELAALRLP